MDAFENLEKLDEKEKQNKKIIFAHCMLDTLGWLR